MNERSAPDLGTVIERTLTGLWQARRAVLVWCAIMMILAIAGLTTMRPMLQASAAMAGGAIGGFDGGTLVRFGLIWSLMTLMLLIVVVAAMRSVLAPRAGRAAYLRFGGDEARVLLVMLMLGIGLYVVMLVVMILIVMIVAAAAAALPGSGAGIVAGVIGVLGALLTIGLTVYVAVRLSLAVPLTLARGRIVLRDAWGLSQGRFWCLFGGYMMTLLIGLVVMTPGLAMQAGEMAAMMAAGSDPDAIARAMAALLAERAAMSPVRMIAIILLTGIGNGLWMAVQGAMAGQLLVAIEPAVNAAPAGTGGRARQEEC